MKNKELPAPPDIEALVSTSNKLIVIMTLYRQFEYVVTRHISPILDIPFHSGCTIFYS